MPKRLKLTPITGKQPVHEVCNIYLLRHFICEGNAAELIENAYSYAEVMCCLKYVFTPEEIESERAHDLYIPNYHIYELFNDAAIDAYAETWSNSRRSITVKPFHRSYYNRLALVITAASKMRDILESKKLQQKQPCLVSTWQKQELLRIAQSIDAARERGLLPKAEHSKTCASIVDEVFRIDPLTL